MEILIQLIVVILSAFVVLLAVAFGSERGTQITKVILRWIAAKFKMPTIAPSGYGSWLLALVPAALMVFGFNVDVLSEFELFGNVDPLLVQLLNMALVWGMSQIEHEKMPFVKNARIE